MMGSHARIGLVVSIILTIAASFAAFAGEGSMPAGLMMTLKGSAIVAILVQVFIAVQAAGSGGFRSAVESQFFDMSQDANFVLDGPRIVDCNKATIDMLRASSREQVLRLTSPSISLKMPC